MPFLDRSSWTPSWTRMTGGWSPMRSGSTPPAVNQPLSGHRASFAAGQLKLAATASPTALHLLDPLPHLCGAAGCAASWSRASKRRRPGFEGERACSARCLQLMIRAAVRRATADGMATETEPHRHRVPLGLVLLAQRWITHPQLQVALERQRLTGAGRIGDHLAETCGLAQEFVTRGLALQWSCPVLNLDGFEPHRMALVMPPRLCREFGMVPLRVAGGELLYLVSARHLDAGLALAVEQMSGLVVETGLVGDAQMDTAQLRLGTASPVLEATYTAADRDDLVQQIGKLLEQKQPVASRLVRVHGYFWLRLWLENGTFSSTGQLPRSAEDMEDHLFTIG